MRYDPADNRFRIRQPLLDQVDRWRKQRNIPTRSEAINQMVIEALEAERKEKPRTTRNGR